MTALFDLSILSGTIGIWADLIVPIVIKGSLLLALLSLINFALRRASASTRHLLWTLGLAGFLLLPVFSAGLPAWQVLEVPWTASAHPDLSTTALPVTSNSLIDNHAQQPGLNSPPQESLAPAAGLASDRTGGLRSQGGLNLPSLSPAAWVLMVWLGGILLLAATVLGAFVRLHNLERRASILDDNGWSELLASLGNELGILRRPRLMRSHRNLTPMTWGIRRVRILLPAGCDGWTEEQRRLVLLHEMAHVKRRDCLAHLTAQLACLFYWFNPLVWLAARRMRVERERACDDLVLIRGVKPSSYASNLLNLTSTFGAETRTLAVSLGMARCSQISGRLLAVLDPKLRRLAPGRLLTLATVVLTLAIVLPLSAVGPAAEAGEKRSRQTDVSITYDKGDNPTKLSMSGEIKLTKDGRGIEWMSDDAFLKLEQKVGRQKRKLEIEPDRSGKPVYNYRIGRKSHPFDDEAADWLAEMLDVIAPDGEFLILELPKLPELPKIPELPSLSLGDDLKIRRSDSDIDITWTQADDKSKLHLEMEGKIKFNDDESAIEWMDDDARFKLEEKSKRQRIRLEAEPGKNGRPVYKYRVGRKEKPFDDEAAEWLAGVLQRILLELGINADQRVQQAFEKDAAQGVLDLIMKVDSDYIKGVYYREYFKLNDLTNGEIAAGLEQACRQVDSDYELSKILLPNVGTCLASRSGRTAFTQVMSSIDSDYEKAKVLKNTLKESGLADDQLVILIETAQMIDSDYETAHVLKAIDPDLLSRERVRQAYFETFKTIDSDYEKAGILTGLAKYARQDPELSEACLKAVEDIDSDYEHRKVTKAFR